MRLLTAALIAVITWGCGREEAKIAGGAAVAPTGSGDAGAPTGSGDATGQKPSGGTPGGQKEPETPAGGGQEPGTSSTASGTPHGPDTPVPVPAKQMSGKEYFNTVVYKLFDTTCTTCHADPRQNPDIRGPLTIFSYLLMKKRLDGSSAAESTLMKKVRAIAAHSGGDRCQAAGPTGSPCKEIMEWWRLENGADSGLAGDLTAVSTAGEVNGFALDVNDAVAVLAVEFSVDGKPALTLPADQAGYDGGYDGTHAFKGMLPPELRDGKPHDLVATVTIGGKDVQVGKAVHFAAYTPKDAGKAFFAKTVAPAMGACTGCHVVAYDAQYASLLNRAPYLGGTAMDNELVNRPSGAVAHPGGNLCGGKTGAPCNLFQQWWALEFQ